MRRILFVVTLVVSSVLVPVGAAGARGGADAPGHPPAADGPYGVGLTTFTATDPARPGRTLTMDIWYPTELFTTSGTPASLELLVTTLTLPGVRRDAQAAVPGPRPFPLVAFSHGSFGTRFQSWFLMEALAANGYVVVAPDHKGNTALDMLGGTADPFPVILQNRPRDISFAIDTALARSADPADLLAGRVDGSRIAVAGHSFGGFTTLAVAAGHQGWGPDERVDAIIPMAASAGLLSDAELSGIRIPTMLMAGTSDVTVPLAQAAERPWSLISSRPSWRVDIHRAGHNSFTNVCDLRDALVDAGLPPALLGFLDEQADEGCAANLVPIDQAHQVIVHYVLAFLRTTIGHDARWEHLLSPQWAERHDLPVTVYARHGGHRKAA